MGGVPLDSHDLISLGLGTRWAAEIWSTAAQMARSFLGESGGNWEIAAMKEVMWKKMKEQQDDSFKYIIYI